MLAVTVKVIRTATDEILMVNNPEFSTEILQVWVTGDAAVDHRDANAGAIPAVLQGDVGVGRGFRVIQGCLDLAVRRDVGYLGICSERFEGAGWKRVATGLHNGKFTFELSAPTTNFLVVHFSRSPLKLHNDIHPGTWIFSDQVFREL